MCVFTEGIAQLALCRIAFCWEYIPQDRPLLPGFSTAVTALCGGILMARSIAFARNFLSH